MRSEAFFILAVFSLPTPALAEFVVPPKRLPPTVKPPAQTGKMGTMSVGQPEPAPPGDLTIGGGYNALTGQYLPGVCVAGTGPNKTYGVSELQGTISHMFINAVRDMQTNASASGSDAGFDFTYKLITVGFSTGSSSETFYNSIDSYGRLFYRVATRGEALRGDTWSGLGKIEIQNKLKRFTQICGTHYIHAIYYGHQIDHTYRFTLNQISHDGKSRDDLSLGVGKLFGFNYSDSDSSKTVDDKSTMSEDNLSRGITPTLPPVASSANGVQELAKYARNTYRAEVLAAAPNTALPVLVELVPYSNLPASGSGLIPSWPDDLRGEISGRAGLYQDFLTVIGDLERATRLPTTAAAALYEDPGSASAKLTNAQKTQTDYRTAVRACVKLLDADEEGQDAGATCSAKLDAVLNPSIVNGYRLKLKAQ